MRYGQKRSKLSVIRLTSERWQIVLQEAVGLTLYLVAMAAFFYFGLASI